MSRTPYIFTQPIGAGLQVELPVAGKMLTIFTITGGPLAVDVQFDNDQFHTFDMARSYPSDSDGFEKVTLRNPTGGAIAVYGMISDGLSMESGGNLILLAIQALLTTINASLAPGTVITPIAPVTLAIDGGGPGTASLIVAANPLRKAVVLMLLTAGAGYLGVDDNVQAATCMGAMIQYGQYRESYTGDIYGVGSDAAQVVYGYELT